MSRDADQLKKDDNANHADAHALKVGEEGTLAASAFAKAREALAPARVLDSAREATYLVSKMLSSHTLHQSSHVFAAAHWIAEVVPAEDKINTGIKGATVIAGEALGAAAAGLVGTPLLVTPGLGWMAYGAFVCAGFEAGGTCAEALWDSAHTTHFQSAMMLLENQRHFTAKAEYARYHQALIEQKPGEVQASQTILSNHLMDTIQHIINTPSKQSTILRLTNEYNLLAFTVSQYNQYFSDEGWRHFSIFQNNLGKKISAYTPSDNEAAFYGVLKTQTGGLSNARQKVIKTDALSQPMQNLLKKAKTTKDFVAGVKQFSIAHELAETDKAILEYASFTERDNHPGQFKQKIDEIKKLSDYQKWEAIAALDASGKIAFELGRLSSTLGNTDLGKGLVISGAVLQGVSAGLLIPTLQGAAILGPVAGIVGAATTIISALIGQDENNSNQIILEQIQLLRQEIVELKMLVAEFRIEMRIELQNYFGALFSQLLHLERHLSLIANTVTHEGALTRDGIAAIIDQQEQDIVAVANSYGVTIPADRISSDRVFESLSRVSQLITKSSSDYVSGRSACRIDIKHNQVDHNELILLMRQGKMFGYLSCLIQSASPNSAAFTVIINPYAFSAFVKSYIHLRYLSQAQQYDTDKAELQAVITKGESFLGSIKAMQHELAAFRTFYQNANTALQSLAALFSYDGVLQAANSDYSHIELPGADMAIVDPKDAQYSVDSMIKRMRPHFFVAAYPEIWPIEMEHYRYPSRAEMTIPNEFFQLAQLKVGKFVYRSDRCGPGYHPAAELYFQYHGGVEIPLMTRKYIAGHPDQCYIDFEKSWKNTVFQAKQALIEFRRKIAVDKKSKFESEFQLLYQQCKNSIYAMQFFLAAIGFSMSKIEKLSMSSLDISSLSYQFNQDLQVNDPYQPLPRFDAVKQIVSQIQQVLFGALQEFETALKGKIDIFSTPEVVQTSLILKELHQLMSHLSTKPSDSFDTPKTPLSTEQEVVPKDDNALLKKIGDLEQEVRQLKQLFAESKKTNDQLLGLLSELLAENKKREAWKGVGGFVQGADAALIADYRVARQPFLLSSGSRDETTNRWICTLINADVAQCFESAPPMTRMRLLMRKPFISQGLSTLENDHYVCSAVSENMDYCEGENTEYVEYRQIERSFSSQLISAAAMGAATSVIPELIGDVLFLSNTMKKDNAETLKFFMNLMMFFTMTYLSEASLCVTLARSVCAYLFYCVAKVMSSHEKVASALSFAASFLVCENESTMSNVAASVAYYTASRAALFVEKKAVCALSVWKKCEESDSKKAYAK